MSARLHVVDSGGTSRLVSRLFVVDSGGTSRLVQRLFVIDSGGTARLVYQGAVYFVFSGNVVDQTVGISFSSAEIQYQSDGDIQETTTNGGTGDLGDWVTPTSLAPGSYTIRAQHTAGSAPNGPALDTDHAISGSPAWNVQTTGALVTSTLFMTLKDGGGNTLATGTVTLQAEAL